MSWIVWNNALAVLLRAVLRPHARAEIFGNSASVYAGSTRPSGRAAVDGEHFRVTGRWSLVSGCELADWLALRCVIEENGQPRMLRPNVPEVRMAWVKRADVESSTPGTAGGLAWERQPRCRGQESGGAEATHPVAAGWQHARRHAGSRAHRLQHGRGVCGAATRDRDGRSGCHRGAHHRQTVVDRRTGAGRASHGLAAIAEHRMSIALRPPPFAG